MLNNRLIRHTARYSGRGGFTLVELLVVIGIIAILAGVALGPITNGIKKAQQSGGVQTSRTLALAEFQYANDNNQNYPDKGTPNSLGAGDATDVAACLIAGGYVTDPAIFVISGSSEKKYTGTMTGTPTIGLTNISWDFVGNSATGNPGINPNTPDTTPVILSSSPVTGANIVAAGAPTTVQLLATNPFGKNGIAVAYKSNSAKFITAPASGICTLFDTSYPGWTAASKLAGGG